MAEFGLGADRLVLMGFSQGCMLALELRAPPALCSRPRNWVFRGFSWSNKIKDEAVSRPPIFLGHGEADQVVPFAAMAAAEIALTSADFKVETQTYAGLGHGIDPEGMQRLYEIIKTLDRG